MKGQTLFSGKNNITIVKLSSAEFAHKVVKQRIQWKLLLSETSYKNKNSMYM